MGKPDYVLLQECDEICKFYVNERDHSQRLVFDQDSADGRLVNSPIITIDKPSINQLINELDGAAIGHRRVCRDALMHLSCIP